MSKLVLITGGAGFVGSHVGDELLEHGYRVRALDNLSEQVHGEGVRPNYLNSDIELIVGDIRNPEIVNNALQGANAVIHLAAAVGVGQSMYEITRYTEINNIGTAVLMEALINSPVERLVAASSMSIYGEGLYQTAQGEIRQQASRDMERLRRHEWELIDSAGETLIPIPTPESKVPTLASIYALSKYDQEQMCHIIGAAYNIPTVALRFFNIYGPRQALSNPYTGVLAIFASRLLNSKPPLINEDGFQQRDFVSVHDVAQACRLALEARGVAGQSFNIGSGEKKSIREVASAMSVALACEHIVPEVTQKYRKGDIRHCYADITAARNKLGYEPSISFEGGLSELADWLSGQSAEDRVAQASAELSSRGLTL
jgi:dTDP-L-rhamnose 4-epimerase